MLPPLIVLGLVVIQTSILLYHGLHKFAIIGHAKSRRITLLLGIWYF
jgi:hypothetical protein